MPPLARRILEIRGLLMVLRPLRLTDHICREFDLDQEELKLLAHIETILKPEETPFDSAQGPPVA